MLNIKKRTDMSKDTFWFKHDYDAADDDKTMLLIEQLGLEGYGIYWVLIEKLRGRTDYKMPFSMIPSLARRYMTTPEKMKTVVTQYGLFEFDEDGFFYSTSLIQRMEALTELKNKRSAAGRLGNAKRWGEKRIEQKDGLFVANLSQCDSNEITEQLLCVGNAVASRRDKNRVDESRIDNKEKEDNKLSSKKSFDFFNALRAIGVEEQVAKDWIAVRKTKKATNTETAFKKIVNQIELCNASPNDCITLAVERSWSGFQAEWYMSECGRREADLFSTAQTECVTVNSNKWQTI